MSKTTLAELLKKYKAQFVSLQPNCENFTVSHMKDNTAKENYEVETDTDKVWVKLEGKKIKEVK